MADPKQFALLKRGVARWNAWRKKHPGEKLDLRWVELSEADLRDAILSKAELSEANLGRADLSTADLSESRNIGTNTGLAAVAEKFRPLG